MSILRQLASSRRKACLCTGVVLFFISCRRGLNRGSSCIPGRSSTGHRNRSCWMAREPVITSCHKWQTHCDFSSVDMSRLSRICSKSSGIQIGEAMLTVSGYVLCLLYQVLTEDMGVRKRLDSFVGSISWRHDTIRLTSRFALVKSMMPELPNSR